MADEHQPLIESLARYRDGPVVLPEERDGVERTIAFLRTRPRGLFRDNLDGHLTGSAWVLDHSETQAVLLHHRKLTRWLQPGGHADGDPQLDRVARAEATEECGIDGLLPKIAGIFDVDVHAIPARAGEPAHFHYDLRFCFVAPPGAKVRGNEESHAVRFVSLEEVEAFTSERSVLRLRDKSLGRERPSPRLAR